MKKAGTLKTALTTPGDVEDRAEDNYGYGTNGSLHVAPAAGPGDQAGHYVTHDPTVVEFGISPLRVTVPLTDEKRRQEAWKWGASMVVGAGVLLYFGGAWLKDFIRDLRG